LSEKALLVGPFSRNFYELSPYFLHSFLF
jgi:hypothetical protein